MRRNYLFCENCRHDVEYEVKEKDLEASLLGKKYKYVGKEVVCAECGNPLFASSVDKDNLLALYDVYRKENGLISLAEVQEVSSKCHLTDQTLSRKLGWEVDTISRYHSGDLPSKEHSDVLQQLYKDPSSLLNFVK